MCSMMWRSVMPRVASRMPSISCDEGVRDWLPPLPATAATLWLRLRPLARAASCSSSMVRVPMPRVGKFTTRRKLVSSFGFSISRR